MAIAKPRTPAVPRPSCAGSIKQAYKNSAKNVPLRQFARELAKGDGSLSEKARNWFFNKNANFSKPPLGIGRTRKKRIKKGSQPSTTK
jgi:hypothetical protein